jgi:hypothetical protein
MLATRNISAWLWVIVYLDLGILWGKSRLSVRGVLGVEVCLHAPLTLELDGGEW